MRDLLLTNAQMREADEHTIQILGVPARELMERAGQALCDQANVLASSGEILCVCGGGNNGGDGFVCARLLQKAGKQVECLLVGEPRSDLCKENFALWTQIGGFTHREIPAGKRYALIIDCLYGTGFHGELQQRDLVEYIAQSGANVLAADIPSGVNGDNGRVESVAIRADYTLAIGEKKAGLYLGDGMDFAGEAVRVDIGIALPRAQAEYARLIDEEFVKNVLPKRKRNTHKGSYGKAAIVAGSEQYLGAAYLSCSAEKATLACMRSGAGYTTLYLPEKLLSAFALKMPECLLKSINDGGRYAFNEETMRELLAYDTVAFGTGMGVSQDVYLGVKYLLENYQGKLILDADALNAWAEFGKDELLAICQKKKCSVVLTPHIKEFSRLSGEGVQNILSQGLFAPKAFAKAHNLTVILKNAATIITNGERTFVNVRGTSGQAKAGSGDVLAGVVTGLCASGLSVFDAGCVGAYLTGKAAELAVEKIGEYSLLASDVIAYLGGAFCHILHS